MIGNENERTKKFKIFDLRSDQLESILDFCGKDKNGRPPYYQRSLIKRLMTQLASSMENTLDVIFENQRVAVVTIVDKIENPTHSANIEVIGLDTSFLSVELFESIFCHIEKMQSRFEALEVGLDPSLALIEPVVVSRGFKLHYLTYTMKLENIVPRENDLQTNTIFQPLNLDIFDQYYSVLYSSFSKNLETSIPPLDEMKKNFDVQKANDTLLLKFNSIAVGFFSVAVDEDDSSSGEVRMIGVLPEKRSQGIGRILLSKALCVLSERGCKSAHLTVAVTNESALKLYEELGFIVSEKFSSYQMFPKILLGEY